MPSILPGYEYDIFISYRMRDNHAEQWVTNFVQALNQELESTFKEEISIYFDENPLDGLLETHHVDKSLEGKLNCVIFIPILSQIYCDPKSFAWQNEFCTFNKMAQAESIGRDVKLRNGNVSSRILPVAIHHLDPEDRNLIERELGTKLRPIDFIFRSPGVNRPLLPEDLRQENVNNLFYRDQLNKLANAIKEIMYAIRYPDRVMDPYAESMMEVEKPVYEEKREKNNAVSKHEKSIAVLPFVSLSHDPSQEYFADGITENILIELSNIPELRVISRTSVMRYKKTEKTSPEIATELGVKYILEGSAQAHGQKIRITVQLINAMEDQPLWSKVFVEKLDDIFEIQNHVAEVVAAEMKSSLKPKVKEGGETPTKNIEAYDLFLKGRHAFNQWNVDGYRIASSYFTQAIEKDPEFKQAYSYLASSYSARMSWNGDLSPREALVQIEKYLDEAWRRGPSDNDFLTKAFVEFFIRKDFQASEKLLLQAGEAGPNNAMVWYTYSYLLNMMGRFREAFDLVKKAKEIDPLTVAYFNYQFLCLYLLGQHEEALSTLREALKLYPSVVRLYDFLGRIYLTMGRYEECIEAIQRGLCTVSFRPPSMVAYEACSFAGLGNKEKAENLKKELIQRSEANEKGIHIYLVYICAALGDMGEGFHWKEKARDTNDVDLIWWDVDPLLAPLREYIPGGKSTARDYGGVEKHIIEVLKKEMPKLPYHNVEHVFDVVKAAMEIAEKEGLGEEEKKLLRLAALFHDSGFMESAKNHEERGAVLAREILPSYGFDEDAVDLVEKMILATKIPQSPVTLSEKILCDADLDYLGREDFFEIGSRLYDELLESGVVETTREWNLIQKTFLESHRYHTRFSRENREPVKNKNLQVVSSKIRN